ncbi:MAG: two-component sensor histidine kinase [Lachnospiraceae bacterium]|nr:two-component sensor histidine kinase [Lachnospiraceae bacterium]
MRYSIKRQIAVVFIGVFASAMSVCLIINTLFLEEYYKSNKRQTLLGLYGYLKESAVAGTIGSDQFYTEVQRICEKGNVELFIMNSSHEIIFASMGNLEAFQNVFFNYLLKDKNSQQIIRESIDPANNSEYMDMWGNLGNEYFYLMRTAVESIRESVVISNRFLIYVGFATVLVSCVLVSLITKKLTKPLKNLVYISDRMIHLDFDAKYTRTGDNEFDLLGERMNLLSETLEATISELKTANNELLKDIERKEEIDSMRQEFLSNVSHELKTPIALIQGYAEGLKECVQDDEESRDFYCDVIMDEAHKMNQLVKNLLTLNQLEFGNEVVSFERFDLTSLIRNILNSTKILAGERTVTVNFDDSREIYAWADEFKIEEVVTNYISNAFHYVSGENIIEISMLEKEDTVRVTVFNSGEPIPEEDLDKIWIKFYKVDKSRTREYGGSGIGLSIVKAIMDSYNRPCGVENYENGVAFWFEVEKARLAE